MQRALICFFLLSILSLTVAHPQSLSAETTNEGVLIREGNDSVLFYQKQTTAQKGAYQRADYVHPLYGLDGSILTEDFPDDHPHHRGIFWAWHQVLVGDSALGDGWTGQDFEWDVRATHTEPTVGGARLLRTQTHWQSPRWTDAAGKRVPFLSEQVQVTVYPRQTRFRVLDFKISLLALVPNLRLGGSDDEKGYGGFSVRMRLPEDVRFAASRGDVTPATNAVTAGPWMNISGALGNDERNAGIVIMGHQTNPTHPEPWILRKTASMQNPVYPGRAPLPVSDQEPTVLQYRLVIYENELPDKRIDSLYQAFNYSDSFRAAWNSLLQEWYPRAIDSVYGGYRANFDFAWQPLPQQHKMVVTQARHLWTTAKAVGLHPQEPLYGRAADHGYQFLRDKLWDEEHGGFRWRVDQKGAPLPVDSVDHLMRTYGNAFGIYALAAYHRYRQDKESLALAQRAFRWLEQHAYDPQHGGYFAATTEAGQAIDAQLANRMNLPPRATYKDQNTSIHLLEAFTELYHEWPDSLLRQRLAEMLVLVRDTMVTDAGYLQLYFQPDWTPVSYRDSSQTVREANYALDHVSFGHDIETAFLLREASEALYGTVDDTTQTVAKKLVDHTLQHGFDSQRSGIYDQGYYQPGTDSVTIVNNHKAWWSQAEGLNTLSRYANLYPEDSGYQDTFQQLWQYVQQYVIDSKYGGWYSQGIDTAPAARYDLKGQQWKGNYHNGRTLMHLAAPPEAYPPQR